VSAANGRSRSNALLGAEVSEQIRRALRGEAHVLVTERCSWVDAYCGDVAVMVGDWRMVFFNDCGELDYCASARAPDGREGDFDEWYDDQQEPVELLTPEEYRDFERMLEQAPNEKLKPTRGSAFGLEAPVGRKNGDGDDL
jgi:hypothetical protein